MKSDHRILIVDDDPVNVEILTEILGTEYTCMSARSGSEALKIKQDFRPDIILLDIMMPGMDGYEVCKHIRNEETTRFTKIILVSGRSMTEDRLRGYDAGADDYITKPFNDDELIAKINVFLKLKSLEEVDEVKRDIINIFSHETRTPLSAIVGSAQILLEDKSINSENRELTELIIEGAKQIAEIVHKTTLLCRLKSGCGFRKSEFAASECLRNAIEANMKEAGKKNINFGILIEKDSTINGDSELLTEAVSMLIENAIRYSDNNSDVNLRLFRDNKNAIFHVEDNGEGLSGIEKRALFDDFSISNTPKHTKGMGLGLNIVRYIAEMHGGSSKAEDSENMGSVFTLSVPYRGSEK